MFERKKISPIYIDTMQSLEHTSNIEETQKPKQVRPKRAAWRYNEDGTYNNRPLAEDYFNKYYHEKLAVKVECPHCKKFVTKQSLGRHMNTERKCLRLRDTNLYNYILEKKV